MSLHPHILFIGDRPNPRKNRSMDVPFVGTKSYLVLLEWFYKMDVDVNQVSIINAYDVHGSPKLGLAIGEDTKIITLGANATSWLKSLDTPRFKYFALPHPSGLNRELNDVKKLSDLLARCRAFIYSQT